MRQRLASRFVLGLLLAAPLGGCVSGQTGSPDCVGPRSCVCDPLYAAGNQLRVRVESYRDGRLRAAVTEVLQREPGTSAVAVDDGIGGSVDLSTPCAPEASLSLTVGSELFVLFSPGSGADALLDGYFAMAIPWSDPLSFGGMHALPLAELSVLTSTASCLERFPLEPAPPCHDTSTVTCAMAPSARSEPPTATAWLALGLGIAALGSYRAHRRALFRGRRA